MGIIYKITNVVTDDFYVGSAVKPKRRKWEHWTDLKKQVHHCFRLQEAWNKYGEDAFEFAEVEQVSDEKLLQVEDMYLMQHAGKPHCYNSALSTQVPSSTQPEIREKISASLKRIYAADPTNHPRTGTKHSEETKQKISQNRMGKMAGEEHYRYGKTVSEEIRKKIGDAQRGVKKAPRIYTPEGLEKARANMREHGVIPEKKGFDEVYAKFPQEMRDYYDFTNAVYAGALTRIEGCVCPKHGVFSQYAAQIRKGRGCPSCGAEVRGQKKKVEMLGKWADPEERQKMLEARK